MKTKDITRGVTSRHYRLGAGSPDTGRLGRGPAADMIVDGGHRRRKRGSSRESEKSSALAGLLLVGGAALAVITATVFVWLMPRLGSDPVAAGSTAAQDDRNVRIASKFPSPSREMTLEIVERALAARDKETVLALFRTGDSSPEEIIRFLEESALRDGGIETCEWLSSLDKDGLLIEGVFVRFKGRDQPVNRLALLTPDDEGTWKLDFQGFARLVEPSWNDLLENKAHQAEVRVTVVPGVYYNGAFSDDTEWVCYSLSSPDLERSLCGYCRTGSPEAEAMARLFKYGDTSSRATIEIRHVPGGEPHQFEIVRLLGGEWVIASNP